MSTRQIVKKAQRKIDAHPAVSSAEVQDKMLFPDKEWIRCAPEEQGFEVEPLAEVDNVMKRGAANGVLIRNGHIVKEWLDGGPPATEFHAQSAGKSITSLVLGLALDDKLIPGLDTKVKEIHPAFEAGPFTEQITFRHLATMTSGIKTTRHQFNYKKLTPPGYMMNYTCDQCAHLARALTYLYGKTLYDVLKERILDPLGVKARWDIDEPPWSPVTAKNGAEVPVNTGYGCIYWTARDLARVGYLFLKRGKWKGEQLISAGYIKECWTEISLKDPRPHQWGNGYGLYWWRIAPGVWYMSGWGGQFCLVWPDQDIVMVKLNDRRFAGCHPQPFKWFVDHDLHRIYPFLHRALTGRDFVMPLEWKVGMKATGAGDNEWEISP